MSRRTALLALLAALSAGCSDEAGPNGGTNQTGVDAALTNFPPSSPTQGHYELWISFATPRAGGTSPRHSEAASAGKFRIDAAGNPVGLQGEPIVFEVSPEDPNAQVSEGRIVWALAADSFITVEPAGDTDDEPHLPGLVAGAFVNGVSPLDVDESDAINEDFTGAAGSFVLATPTTPATTDETEGVWFSSLALPTLAPGAWTYTGWSQPATGAPVSLGGFRDPDAPDDDGAGPLGGTGYSYPGSDFPCGQTGIDLATGTVTITLEPPADADGPGPFLPILGRTFSGVSPGTPTPLTRVDLPGGTVTIPFEL